MVTANKNIQLQARVVGSEYTVLLWQGQPLARCTSVADPGQPFSNPPDYIHPIGEKYAQEIVTPHTLQPGTITLTLVELWDAPAWAQLAVGSGLAGIASAADLIEIMDAQNSLQQPITIQTIIKPPSSTRWRGWSYVGVKITDADMKENIEFGTITLARTVTCMYTQRKRLSMAASS